MRKIQLRFLFLAVCASFLTACWSTPANTNTVGNTSLTNSAPPANTNSQSVAEPSRPANATSSGRYPQDTRDAFLRSCQGAGSAESFCLCVFEKVEARYSFEEFKKIEDAMLDGDPPAEFVKFTEKTRAGCTK